MATGTELVAAAWAWNVALDGDEAEQPDVLRQADYSLTATGMADARVPQFKQDLDHDGVVSYGDHARHECTCTTGTPALVACLIMSLVPLLSAILW
jgi:hypothetical protein